MNRILICFTGGTFSATHGLKGVLNVSEKANAWFMQHIEQKYKGDVAFEYSHSAFMLSENMHPEVWEKITNDLNEKLAYSHNFDGVVVIHGSDTAVYTTSFLGHYYKRLPVPLVVTASNAPVEEVRSNGLNNFYATVDFICKEKRQGTYFIYQSKGNRGDIIVYNCTELLDASPYTDEYEYTTDKPYGIIKDGEFVGVKNKKIEPEDLSWRFNAFEYKNRILGISPYTGLDYSTFNLDNIVAVVHGAFHSNTFNTLVDVGFAQYSLAQFTVSCKARGIAVYLADFPTNRLDAPVYESTQSLLDNGANVMFLPMENVFAKAVYAYNQQSKDPHKLMMEED